MHFEWKILLLLLLLLSFYTSVIYIYNVASSLGYSFSERLKTPVAMDGAYIGMQVESKMEGKLVNRVSVLVIVEGEALLKIDKLAGAGNRSAYIRYLIDTVDGTEARKYIELEARVRVLTKIPLIQANKISELELKVDQLKAANKQLVSGVSPDLGDIPGVLEEVARHKMWVNSLLARNIHISHGKELDRLRIRAKDIGVKPDGLRDYIHTALNVKGLDINKMDEI